MAERWQTSEGRVAAVFFRDSAGAPVTGLTPTAASNYKDGTGGAPAVTVAEVANGFYRLTFAAAPTKDVLVRVDGGATLTTTRYAALEVPVGGYVDSIDAAITSRASAAAVTAISAAVTALGSPAQAADTTTLLARLSASRATLLDSLALLDVAVSTRATPADVHVTVTGSSSLHSEIS